MTIPADMPLREIPKAPPITREAYYRDAPEHQDASVESRFKLANFLATSNREADTEHAKSIYIQIIDETPDSLGAWINLGILLFETGYISAAATAFTAAASYHPHEAAAHTYLGNVLLYQNRLSDARRHFETALQLSSGQAEAHQGLASVFRRMGDEKNAALHRNIGFKNQSVSTLNHRGEGEPVQLLVLTSAKEGNIPWRLLIDRGVFHTTLLAVDYFDAPLPPHQLVFNAIGDADLCCEELEKAVNLLKTSRATIINRPDAVLQTGRMGNTERLANIPGVTLPRMVHISRADINAGKMQPILAEQTLFPPLLLRSPGFHGGNYFVFVDSADDLNTAAEKLPGETLLAIEFLDSRNQDGLFRKYRVMCIDGVIYPIHMAISTQWNVHYFSSDMAENAQFRIEEAAFLNDISTCLGQQALSALTHICQTLALDYCGIDFGLDAEKNILLYEANATMVINPPGHEAQWDYRRAAIDNALAAARRMFAGRMDEPIKSFSSTKSTKVTKQINKLHKVSESPIG